MKTKNLKKGDKAYIIVDDVIIECHIEKITTEDRIKSYSSKSIFQKSKVKVIIRDDANYSTCYPAKLAWISYVDIKGQLHERWEECDLIKKNANEFLEFITN